VEINLSEQSRVPKQLKSHLQNFLALILWNYPGKVCCWTFILSYVYSWPYRLVKLFLLFPKFVVYCFSVVNSSESPDCVCNLGFSFVNVYVRYGCGCVLVPFCPTHIRYHPKYSTNSSILLYLILATRLVVLALAVISGSHCSFLDSLYMHIR